MHYRTFEDTRRDIGVLHKDIHSTFRCGVCRMRRSVRQMSAFEKYGTASVSMDNGTCGCLHIGLRCNIHTGEHTCFGNIRRHHCRYREKAPYHLGGGTVIAETVATGGYSYRVENHRPGVSSGQDLGYSGSGGAVGNHTYLDCIGAHIIEDGFKLGSHRIGTDIYIGAYTHGVLGGDCRNCSHGKDTQSHTSLDVGLDAGAAYTIATGHG